MATVCLALSGIGPCTQRLFVHANESRVHVSHAHTNPVPILWIVGSVGTGKSDTSYHLFSRLFRSGTPIARLDLDDVGMCHPAPEDDPDNHRIKAAAMGATWSVYQANGATCFVVSGGVNIEMEVELHKRQIPHAQWTVVRLRISADERRRRTEARGRLLGQDAETIEWFVEGGIEDEATLEAECSFADFTIDTDGLTQQQVVDRVLHLTGWPARRQ